ncbi:Ig-like domain-containing protein [Bacillus sp. ISL-46]|uniref:Ig-like domain-containing protein n=1 Tax=Bacillus sp. ISL-46 TaxID=2819129 RepID=UPI001BE68348|nr:Ig-like domain-containing protein [Bacillus sp. ISL-46]MBT2724297.1 SpoIID/LytB domain-containing protein [Bacillus sp. ISL-46]
MRKLFILLIATIVFLGIVPSYKEAAAIAKEPQIQVKLVKYLGNHSSISLKIVGSYYLNGNSSNRLIPNKSYTVKVENGTLSLYDGNTRLASEAEISITPVDHIDHAIINDREYAGSFRFTVENNQYVRPINTINLENYVKSVVPVEMYGSWPMEALKAQAIAARTYAFYRLNKTINDTISYQVYGGVTSEYPKSSDAVDATTGEILTYNGNTIDAVFSASNGGITENKFNNWTSNTFPYFKVQTDEYDTTITWNVALHKQQIDYTSLDLKNPDSWWNSKNEIDADFTSNIKKWMMNHLPGLSNKQIKIVSIPKVTFSAPTESGRFSVGELSVEFFVKDEFNPNGELELQTTSTGIMLADNIRAVISSKNLKSNLFTLNETTDAYLFSGLGNGHGVGLSQYGAYYRASAGILYKDILSFYYPGTVLFKQYKSAPERAIVYEVTDKDTSVTGEAEAGSTVEVKVNGSTIGSAKAGTDGKFTVVIPVQVAGTELVITATDIAGNVSDMTVVVVKDAIAPTKPVVKQVSDKDTTVTGLAEDGTKVEVKVNGSVIGTGRAGEDGQYKVTIPAQKAGTELVIIATDNAGNISNASTIKVIDKTAPAVLTVNTVSDKSTGVTGTTEAGATVTIIIGTKSYTAKADSKGNYKVIIPVQKAGTKLIITAKDAAGNVSVAKSITVLDKTAPGIPTVSTVSDLTKVVTGKAEIGATVTVTIRTKKYTAKADAKGNFKVTIPVQKAGTKLIVIAKDAAGNISIAKSVIVIDKTAPFAPKIKTTVKSTTKEVTGTAEAYSTITIKVGSKVIGTAKADSKGNFKVKIKAQKKKAIISVTATDKARNISKATTVKVK